MGRRAGRPSKGIAPGYPTFEHNQWTFEGEMERLGAFATGAARARGWKRTVARALVALILLPFAVGVAVYLVRLAL